MNLSRLVDLSNRYIVAGAHGSSRLPGLTVLRRVDRSDLESVLYEPVMCLILRGSKVTAIGDQFVQLHPGDALIVSHDLPVASRITMASVEEPYLAVILALDLNLARTLYEEVADFRVAETRARSLSAGKAEPALLEALGRLLELMDSARDARILGPSIRREIHYRLLISPEGQMLRDLLVADTHASRIAKAIRRLRAELQLSLSVAELARTAGMSVSSFHEHFRSVTGTTPLRYQKELRLIAARTLLLVQGQTVSAAAFAVGYESPSQFSREYSRKFGLPPSRDNARAARVQNGSAFPLQQQQ